MYYEINVSLNGQHFFATAERSIQTEAKLKQVFNKFKETFPESEGYQLDARKYQTIGEPVYVACDSIKQNDK